MDTKQYFFSDRDLRKLIIPLIIEQFLTVVVGMIDSIMIASVGEAAVSAISLIDNVNILIINFFTALATGGAVVIGQYIGQKRGEDAKKTCAQLTLISILMSVAITALVYIFRIFILNNVFGRLATDVWDYSYRYLMIVALSIPFIAMYNVGAAVFRVMGMSKISMQISIYMNIINIVGNAILIYGVGMEVEGAAIPTLISRAFAGIYMFILLCNKKNDIHVKPKNLTHFDGRKIKKILQIGIPNSLENSMFQLGKILVLGIVAAFGTSAITANAVSSQIATFQLIPGMALNYTMLSVVSRCIGALDFEQVNYYTKKLMKIQYCALTICIGAVTILLNFILKAYNLTEETTEVTRNIVYYHSICAIFIWAISFTLPGALRAASDVNYCMIVSILSMWIFRIGFSVVFAKVLGWGVFGVWVAMTTDWLVRSILFVARYKSGAWKTKFNPES